MSDRKIADILPRQDVLTLSPGATVDQAARLMASRHVGAVLVADDGALKGIFTERDIVEKVVAVGLAPEQTRLSQVMTARPVTIAPHTPVRMAVGEMRERHLRHLPVMRDGGIVGIVSLRDVVLAEGEAAP